MAQERFDLVPVPNSLETGDEDATKLNSLILLEAKKFGLEKPDEISHTGLYVVDPNDDAVKCLVGRHIVYETKDGTLEFISNDGISVPVLQRIEALSHYVNGDTIPIGAYARDEDVHRLNFIGKPTASATERRIIARLGSKEREFIVYIPKEGDYPGPVQMEICKSRRREKRVAISQDSPENNFLQLLIGESKIDLSQAEPCIVPASVDCTSEFVLGSQHPGNNTGIHFWDEESILEAWKIAKASELSKRMKPYYHFFLGRSENTLSSQVAYAQRKFALRQSLIDPYAAPIEIKEASMEMGRGVSACVTRVVFSQERTDYGYFKQDQEHMVVSIVIRHTRTDKTQVYEARVQQTEEQGTQANSFVKVVRERGVQTLGKEKFVRSVVDSNFTESILREIITKGKLTRKEMQELVWTSALAYATLGEPLAVREDALPEAAFDVLADREQDENIIELPDYVKSFLDAEEESNERHYRQRSLLVVPLGYEEYGYWFVKYGNQGEVRDLNTIASEVRIAAQRAASIGRFGDYEIQRLSDCWYALDKGSNPKLTFELKRIDDADLCRRLDKSAASIITPQIIYPSTVRSVNASLLSAG